MKKYTEEMSNEYVRGLQEIADACDYLLSIYSDKFEFERGLKAGLAQAQSIALSAIKREKIKYKEWYEE